MRLDKDQWDDGTFRSCAYESFDQVLAAFALSDDYWLTGETARKRSAQRAVDALVRMQKADGSWEGAGPTAWAIVALYCAIASELAVDAASVDRALRASAYPGHSGQALAR